MDNNAIAPQDVVINIFGSLKKEQEKTFETLKEDDKLWKEFYGSSYYEMIEKYINSLCANLDSLEDQAWEVGASEKEIVMRRAVARLTRVNLKSLLTKIEQTGKQQ